MTKQFNYELGKQRNKVWNRLKQDKEVGITTLFPPT